MNLNNHNPSTAFKLALQSAQNKDQLRIIWDSMASQMKGLKTHDYIEVVRFKSEVLRHLQ